MERKTRKIVNGMLHLEWFLGHKFRCYMRRGNQIFKFAKNSNSRTHPIDSSALINYQKAKDKRNPKIHYINTLMFILQLSSCKSINQQDILE